MRRELQPSVPSRAVPGRDTSMEDEKLKLKMNDAAMITSTGRGWHNALLDGHREQRDDAVDGDTCQKGSCQRSVGR